MTTTPLGTDSSDTLATWSEDPAAARARRIWSSADFHPIARSFAPGAAAFVDRLTLQPGERVLDVACGTGNLAIPAARAGAVVRGIDIAANLIEVARREARQQLLDITFDVGQAEFLPYQDDEFDTTISMFGAMFAYRPVRAAAELMRVTKPGGRMVMANWTPDSFVGDMLRAHTAIVPPPSGSVSPLTWGTPDIVHERFGNAVQSVTLTKRAIALSFPLNASAVTELFATCYGPTVATLAAADPAGASQLREHLTRLFRERNIAPDGGTTVVSEYLEVVAIKR